VKFLSIIWYLWQELQPLVLNNELLSLLLSAHEQHEKTSKNPIMIWYPRWSPQIYWGFGFLNWYHWQQHSLASPSKIMSNIHISLINITAYRAAKKLSRAQFGPISCLLLHPNLLWSFYFLFFIFFGGCLILAVAEKCIHFTFGIKYRIISQEWKLLYPTLSKVVFIILPILKFNHNPPSTNRAQL
jgi:hypothetical protein